MLRRTAVWRQQFETALRPGERDARHTLLDTAWRSPETVPDRFVREMDRRWTEDGSPRDRLHRELMVRLALQGHGEAWSCLVARHPHTRPLRIDHRWEEYEQYNPFTAAVGRIYHGLGPARIHHEAIVLHDTSPAWSDTDAWHDVLAAAYSSCQSQMNHRQLAEIRGFYSYSKYRGGGPIWSPQIPPSRLGTWCDRCLLAAEQYIWQSCQWSRVLQTLPPTLKDYPLLTRPERVAGVAMNLLHSVNMVASRHASVITPRRRHYLQFLLSCAQYLHTTREVRIQSPSGDFRTESLGTHTEMLRDAHLFHVRWGEADPDLYRHAQRLSRLHSVRAADDPFVALQTSLGQPLTDVRHDEPLSGDGPGWSPLRVHPPREPGEESLPHLFAPGELPGMVFTYDDATETLAPVFDVQSFMARWQVRSDGDGLYVVAGDRWILGFTPEASHKRIKQAAEAHGLTPIVASGVVTNISLQSDPSSQSRS